MEHFEQQRCPKDNHLGSLIKIKSNRYAISGNPFEIVFTWCCQHCGDIFETRIPYLEIRDFK